MKLNYGDNPSLKKISFGKDGVISSNIYSAILAYNLFEKEAVGRILTNFGLVLGNEKFPNEYLVKKLMKQVKEKEFGFQNSVLVFGPPNLEIILDKKAPEGLAFKIKDNLPPIFSPQLVSGNNKKKFKNLDEIGMPIFDEGGDKTLYVRGGGLLKLCESEHKDLYCWDSNLNKEDENIKLVVFVD